MDSDGYLTDVVETHNIVKVTENFSVQAKVDDTPIDIESCVEAVREKIGGSTKYVCFVWFTL